MTTNLTAQNELIEQTYRDCVLDFLHTNTYKLYKSRTEKNKIVSLSDINFEPNKTLGRQVGTFTSKATEVAENTIENLQKYDIIIEEKDVTTGFEGEKFYNFISGTTSVASDIIIELKRIVDTIVESNNPEYSHKCLAPLAVVLENTNSQLEYLPLLIRADGAESSILLKRNQPYSLDLSTLNDTSSFAIYFDLNYYPSAVQSDFEIDYLFKYEYSVVYSGTNFMRANVDTSWGQLNYTSLTEVVDILKDMQTKVQQDLEWPSLTRYAVEDNGIVTDYYMRKDSLTKFFVYDLYLKYCNIEGSPQSKIVLTFSNLSNSVELTIGDSGVLTISDSDYELENLTFIDYDWAYAEIDPPLVVTFSYLYALITIGD